MRAIYYKLESGWNHPYVDNTDWVPGYSLQLMKLPLKKEYIRLNYWSLDSCCLLPAQRARTLALLIARVLFPTARAKSADTRPTDR